MQTQENVVLLAVSGLVLGLFRGPLGSWVYGMAPLRPGLGVLMCEKNPNGNIWSASYIPTLLGER